MLNGNIFSRNFVTFSIVVWRFDIRDYGGFRRTSIGIRTLEALKINFIPISLLFRGIEIGVQ